MATAQINPLLIEKLIDKKNEEVPEIPTRSWLTGKYVKSINKEKDKVEKIFNENPFMLTCKNCNRKGKYDVGLMIVNNNEGEEKADSTETIQTTGYFRCKHCNNAGKWETSVDFLMASLTGIITESTTGQKGNTMIGKNLLYDGSWHLYSSDAEEHLLNKLHEAEDKAYIWNRLGNLYHKGNRPELATCAFEQSILIDPRQIESHYTLGSLLFQIGDLKNAAYHFKQQLINASDYKELPPEKLREFVAVGLQHLFYIHLDSDEEIPFLPTGEELLEAGKLKEFDGKTVDLEGEIFPDEIDSFYPLAELYMGKQRNRIPKRKRTLKLSVNKNNKQKQKRKKKKRR